MALDDDSDAEFERFLQDDDESSMPTSPVRVKKPAPHKKAYASSGSSAAAITSAAAALLASSKLMGKAGKASKLSKSASDKKSKKREKARRDLSDSEEPPPSYDAAHSGYTDEADPYAFDLRAPSFHLKAEEAEEREPVKKKKEKNEKRPKVEAIKKQPRSVISIEDRVAEILKRTGSSMTPAGLEENEVSGAEPVSASDPHAQENTQEDAAKSEELALRDTQQESAGSGKSSASDSLGMESADFEVGVHAKRKLELSRLSLSSLNSEKFAVNIGALEESERTPSRYQQPADLSFASLDKSEYGTSEYSDKNDYGDDDFELDQTTIGGFPELKNPDTTHSAQVSQGSEVDVPAPAAVVQDSETFGYDDDDFEDDGATQQDERQAEPTLQSSVLASLEMANDDADAGYEDEAFESKGYDATPSSFDVKPAPGLSTDTSDSHATENATKLDFAALLAEKYGDFYAITEEKEPPAPPTTTVETSEPAAGALTMEHLTAEEETPMSPPPPPPPPDDEEDDSDLGGFSLNDSSVNPSPPQPLLETVQDAWKAAAQDQHATPPTVQAEDPVKVSKIDALNEWSTRQSTPTEGFAITSEPSEQPSQAYKTNILQPTLQPTRTGGVGKRFSQIQSDVASLRILREPTERHGVATSASAEHHRSSALGQIAAPTLPNFKLMFDDMGDVEDFIHQSQTLRAQRHSAVATQQSQVKETELALRLQQAQRQIILLKQHIQRVDNNSPGRENEDAELALPPEQDNSGRGNTNDNEQQAEGMEKTAEPHSRGGISTVKFNKLQKEFMTQEKLIKAFQKENEKLMQQLKRAQQGATYDVHTENEALRRQLTEAKQQLEMSGLADASQIEPGDKNRQLRAAVDARLHAEARALSLQEELEAAHEAHRQKQNELRLELDRIKKAKVELECRYEGIDLVKVAHESKQVQLLQKEIALKQKEYEHNLASLQKKLDWYIENQRLLDEQDGQVRRLKQEVRDLKAEIEALHSQHWQRSKDDNVSTHPTPSPAKVRQQKSPFRRSPADIRRIQELEARLVEMEAAMRRRHPDSLVNLILASRKADEESKIAAMEAAFEDKIKAMEREMEATHEAHEKKMKSFRQQQDRLLLQYQRKIRDQDIRLTERSGGGGGASSAAARSARRQTHKDGANNDGNVDEVDRVRRFYTDKMKELERKWEAKYNALKKQRYGAMDQAANDQKKSGEQGVHTEESDTAAVIATLQRKLSEQADEIKELREALMQQETSSARDHAHRSHDQHLEWRERIDELEKQLRASEDAREHLVKTLLTVQSTSAAPSAKPEDIADILHDTAEQKSSKSSPLLSQIRGEVRQEVMAELHRDTDAAISQLETQLVAANDQLKAQTAELDTTRERLEQQVERLTAENQQLQQQAMHAELLREKLEQAARRVSKLEHEVLTLRRRANVPQTPSMLQYRALELKVETLTQKHEMREAELRVLLEQAMMSSHLERLNRERVHRNAIAAKNAEISAFKQQLGEILEELALLQPAVTSAPSSASSAPATKQKAVTTALSSPLLSSPPSSSRYPHVRSRYYL